MKQLFVIAFAICVLTSFAQNDCSNGRFIDPVFEQVLVTPGIPYGSGEVFFDTVNVPGGPAEQPLFLDVYQPLSDQETADRPVIVWAFGGAFVYGARVSPDIVELCQRYAQLGYVCVSIDYRLSDELLVNPSPENATRAVLKGVQDMRASVRFLYRSARDLENLFGIDTNQIYVAGVSAGAFNALHLAYFDDDEVPDVLRKEYERTGRLEGESGNPGYPSRVAGVINLCGALGEKEWLEAGDVPIVSMHGTEDDVVPYDEDTVRILGINYPVAGSAAIHRRANELGIANAFYTWKGAGHTPFVGDSNYMDTTFWFTRDFMYDRVCNQTVGIVEQKTVAKLRVYPNPVADMLQLQSDEDLSEIHILDAGGRTIYYAENTGPQPLINTRFWAPGVYVVHWKNKRGQKGSERLVK